MTGISMLTSHRIVPVCFLLCSALLGSCTDLEVPHFSDNGNAKQLVVDGKPFIALAGELHNSSASSLSYMEGVWDKLEGSGLNTVILPVSWEMIEAEEGIFDFELVDGLLAGAREHGFKLIVTWFGSWKNGASSYVPLWVKSDFDRFPRALDETGNVLSALSVFGEQSAEADARAFAALMQHLARTDKRHRTVLMVQVENEVGLLGASRDFSDVANTLYESEVPTALIDGLVSREDSMDGLALQRWIQQGKPASGSWEEVFGEGMEVDEIFMSWFYARYLDQVAAAGKAVYPLPMFANAWLISPGESHPGDYPSGGPIARELVVWQIGAPHLDLLAPDIYLEDFKQVTSRYHRGGNPLAIPEATGDVWFPLDSFRQFESARNVFWAIAEHDALVFAPFGIEGMSLEDPLFRSYKILGPILPELAAYQGTDRLRGILETRNDSGGTTIRFDRYEFSILFNQKRRPEDVAYGLLLQLDDNSFLVVGEGMTITVDATEGDYQDAALARVLEVRYDDGDWIPVRQLNGDETAQHKRIQVPPTTWDSFDDAPGPRMLMVDLFLRKQDVTEAQNSLQQISPSQQD